MIGFRTNKCVAFRRLRDPNPATRFRLLNLANHLIVDRVLKRDRQHWHLVVNQGNWTVLHLACRITFSVDVADLLELERAFQRNRVLDAAP